MMGSSKWEATWKKNCPPHCPVQRKTSVVSLSNVVGGFNGISSNGSGYDRPSNCLQDGSISPENDRFVFLTSAISSVPRETRGKRTKRAREIDLREVIMGKSVLGRAGRSIQSTAKLEVLPVLEACFQGTLCFPTEACV